jgi:hypothetical protein
MMDGRATANGARIGIGSGGERGSVKTMRFAGKIALLCDANSTIPVLKAPSIELTNGVLNCLERVLSVQFNKLDDLTSRERHPLTELNTGNVHIGNLSLPVVLSQTFCIYGMHYELRIETQSEKVKNDSGSSAPRQLFNQRILSVFRSENMKNHETP